MKVKLIAVLVVISTIFIGAVLWKTDSFVYGDRMSWVEAQTRTQLGAMNRSLTTEFKSLQRVITSFNPETFQKGKVNWNSLTPYYAAATFVVNGSKLEPQILLAKEDSKAASWNMEFVKQAVGNLGQRSQDLKIFVKPFQDNQRGRFVAVIFLSGQRGYALFGSGETFQSLIDSQRGALSSFSIVTSTGLTVGHSIPEYLGSVMRDDPIFKEALSSGSSHGSNIFDLQAGSLYGMYEMVPQTNLYVLSSAPMSEMMKGRSGLWWQFLLLGCGLLVVGSAALLWVIMPFEKKLEGVGSLGHNSLPPSQTLTDSLITAPIKVIAPDPEVLHKDKMQASMRVASALAHEMRGPLSSILGYSQSILASGPESEISQNADSIIRETRSARNVLDKLMGFAGEEVGEKNSLKVEGPLSKALKELEPLLGRKGVKLNKNIQDTRIMDLHVDAIIRALKNIIENSIESMERMSKKEITIDLFEDQDGVHLNISDIGEGIEPQNISKIFDPFFTTRSFQNHMGLGMPVAFGVLKEHGASISVESERGKGTQVKILFAPRAPIPTTGLATPPAAKEKIVMDAQLPQLSSKSPARDEAEASFAEAVLNPEGSDSPLDVNIDQLLELPEEIPPPPDAPPRFTPVEDEGSFDVDDVDSTMVIEAADAVANFSSGRVTAPQHAAKKKVSKLDSYQVEVRRPGKRI